MSNILDLSVIEPDPFIIKLKNGDEFVIPGSVSLSIVLEFENNHKKITENKNKDNKRDYEFMKNSIMKILKLDKANADKITDEYLTDNNLDSINYMTAIIDGFVNHVTKIASDENLESPQN